MADNRGGYIASSGPSYDSTGYSSSYGSAAGNGSTGVGGATGYGTAAPAAQWSSQGPGYSSGPSSQTSSGYGSAASPGFSTPTGTGGYGGGGYGGGYNSNAPTYPGPNAGYQNKGPVGDNYRGGPGRSGSGPGFRGGPGGPRFNNYGDSEQQQDTIFVSGLPEDVTDTQIQEFFGSIGIIKIDKRTQKPKIWIYRDKATGQGKGEATVTYDDAATAPSAIQWFNGKDFQGRTISVSMAERKSFQGSPGGGFRGGRGGSGGGFRGGLDGGRGGFGGGRGGGPGRGREGDWRCPNPDCGNNNFSWRTECNRCKTSKPEGAGGPTGGPSGRGYDDRGPGGFSDRGGFRGGRGGGPMRDGMRGGRGFGGGPGAPYDRDHRGGGGRFEGGRGGGFGDRGPPRGGFGRGGPRGGGGFGGGDRRPAPY